VGRWWGGESNRVRNSSEYHKGFRERSLRGDWDDTVRARHPVG